MRLFSHLTLVSRLTLGLAIALTAACGSDEKPKPNASNISPQVYRPADADLAATYEQTCFGCHTSHNGAAPVTGDKAAWDKRMEKGMDILLENTQQGFKGMPAGGSCPDCSAEEFKALIEFMANPPAPKARQ